MSWVGKMGNAVSGCCQTVCDSSDGAPPPWLTKSSADELGDAIDRKFPGRRGMGAGATAAASADAACQPGFIENFHHGGGVLLLRGTEEGLVFTEETPVPEGTNSRGDRFAEVLGCLDRCYIVCHEVPIDHHTVNEVFKLIVGANSMFAAP